MLNQALIMLNQALIMLKLVPIPVSNTVEIWE